MDTTTPTLTCDHREDVSFRNAQRVTFPMLRTVRTRKKKPQVLPDHLLQRVATQDTAHPPEGWKKMHQGEQ